MQLSKVATKNRIKFSLTPYFLIYFLILLLPCFFVNSLFSQQGHDTKLLVGYTAKPLPPGKGYAQTIDGLFYQGEVGITSFLSVGFGSFIIPFDQPSGGFRTKITFPIASNMYFGVGTFVVLEEYKDVSLISTLLFSVDLNKVQLTIGTGFYGEKINEQSEFDNMITLGAIFPIFKNGYLISENWLHFTSNVYTDFAYLYFPGLAVRWNVKRFSFELGAIGVVGDDGDGDFGAAIPHLGVSFFF